MKVIVLGPGKKTRGGITSVISSYTTTRMWIDYRCVWIETYIDKGTLYKLFFFAKSFLKFVFAAPFCALVHIHLSEPMSAFRKSFYFSIARLFRKPIILHFHAFSPDTTIFGPKKSRYIKMFNKANGIIALSEYWKLQIEKIISSKNNVKVIYNPCPEIVNQQEFKKKNVILYAGAINKRKGYADLINAFADIHLRYKEWVLVFAGNGEIENAKLLAKESGIEDSVVFRGWISGEDKDILFKESSIFCLPSYAEGFPMAVLDAWAYGIPVVTTPVGGLPDILKPGENAMVFEPGDVDTLSKQIETLISDTSLREKLERASIELCRNTFNVNTISQQISELYKKIIYKNE